MTFYDNEPDAVCLVSNATMICWYPKGEKHSHKTDPSRYLRDVDILYIEQGNEPVDVKTE